MSQIDSDDVRSTAQLFVSNARHGNPYHMPYDMCKFHKIHPYNLHVHTILLP